MQHSSTTHFGFKTLQLAQKQGKVDEVFHSVAHRYDAMNDAMSLGLHRAWKDAMISKLRPSKTRPFHMLDVAGGTGDIAFRALKSGGPQTHVTVLDINGSMLNVGRERSQAKNLSSQLDFVEANAEALPFEDNSFDAYTIAFGIRNVPRIDKALSEAHRVLKRGGHFLCLEFSHVDVPVLDKIYDAYSFRFIPRLGEWIAGDHDSYQYLVESIRRFPSPHAFEVLIKNAGFKHISHQLMTAGIVALHSAWKI